MASDKRKIGVFESLAVSALSASFAETVTLPLDTAKVRLQLLDRSPHVPASAPRPGPLRVIVNIYNNEGAAALFKGLEAGVHRQIIFSGIRIGLYPHILGSYNNLLNPGGNNDHGNAHVLVRVAAAMTTSAIGISLANPSDVAKVRTQANQNSLAVSKTIAATSSVLDSQSSSHGGAARAMACRSSSDAKASTRTCSTTPVRAKVPPGLYTGSTWGLYRHIIRTEGVVGGLYSGFLPNLLRNSIISSSEVVAYDMSKLSYSARGVPDGPGLHMLAGLTAGFVATILGNPMDVVSTRIMVAKGLGEHPTMLAMCGQMYRDEGLLSFYKGFTPNFLRIGSFNVVLWMVVEQLSALVQSAS